MPLSSLSFCAGGREGGRGRRGGGGRPEVIDCEKGGGESRVGIPENREKGKGREHVIASLRETHLVLVSRSFRSHREVL
jgi:hypothetical protein